MREIRPKDTIRYSLFVIRYSFLTAFLLLKLSGASQTNLFLNGSFEEINTCTEYKAECGVEAWFYLKDVKAQMLLNESNTKLLGANSFAIFYDWRGYTGFVPIIGTLIPCELQEGKTYLFKGLISAKLNPKLILKVGMAVGKTFYVPGRPFSKEVFKDSIVKLTRIPNTPFFEFAYNFVADGKERYLTFGTFVKEDTVGGKNKLTGTQTISLVLDNFSLTPADANETTCRAFEGNKAAIYEYDFRHKEMDYSLYGKGELSIQLNEREEFNRTQIVKPLPPVKADTLKLGDVLFDFNKAELKPATKKMLENFFLKDKPTKIIDSIYVQGHTDSIGSDARNMQLSLARCQSIRDWLIAQSILSPSAIQVHPFGKSRPVASNKNAAGRALNRRVELIIFRDRIYGEDK